MKRLSNKSKRGFTLLEVMLAVVILAIASTMIMKGFIAVMILAKNNSRYAASGEYNYRRAMNETIVNNATRANQDDVVHELATNSTSSTITATCSALGVGEHDLDLVVDVSAFVDPYAPVYGEASGHTMTIAGDTDPLDLNTAANNRYAFFYDYGQYIGVTSYEGSPHIYRWGYVRYSTLPAGVPANSYIQVGSEYHVYGFYCFNSEHCTSSTDGDGNVTETPDSCRVTPIRYGHVS